MPLSEQKGGVYICHDVCACEGGSHIELLF